MHPLAADPLAMAERMVSHAKMLAPFDFSDEASTHEAMSEKIARLEAAMKQMPQTDTTKTDHFFVPGMYCRRLALKAGTVLVGKKHTAPHFFLCVAGSLRVLQDGAERTFVAGDVIECAPGAKRVIFATEDAAMVTLHKTEKTDLDEIEEELIEPDSTALFDARNAVKALIKGETKCLG